MSVLCSGALGFFMLTRGQSQGDDFASYIMQAKSILAGNTQDFIRHNSFTINNSSHPPGPVAYPWGLPLLLAPIYAVFGLNILALAMMELFFYMGFLVVLFHLARTRLSEDESLILTSVFAFLPALVSANRFILSDIPFLVFSTLALVLVLGVPGKRIWWGVACGASIFMASFLRSNGVLLLVPLLVVVAQAHWPEWRRMSVKAAAPLLIFVGLSVVQRAVLPGGQGSHFNEFSAVTLSSLSGNVRYYARLPGDAFAGLPAWQALYVVVMGFFVVYVFRRIRRDAVLISYGLATMILFVVWPGRQGLRFVYPLLPILFIGAFDGMLLSVGRLRIEWQQRSLSVVRGFWILVAVAGLLVSASQARDNMSNDRAIAGPFDTESRQMLAFVRTQTPKGSVVIVARPRALRLLTSRDAFLTNRCHNLGKADYLVFQKDEEKDLQLSPADAKECTSRIHLLQVFRNANASVYRITN